MCCRGCAAAEWPAAAASPPTTRPPEAASLSKGTPLQAPSLWRIRNIGCRGYSSHPSAGPEGEGCDVVNAAHIAGLRAGHAGRVAAGGIGAGHILQGRGRGSGEVRGTACDSWSPQQQRGPSVGWGWGWGWGKTDRRACKCAQGLHAQEPPAPCSQARLELLQCSCRRLLCSLLTP